MKNIIVEAERASEDLVKALIDAGVLIVTEDGLKCSDVKKVVIPAVKKEKKPEKISITYDDFVKGIEAQYAVKTAKNMLNDGEYASSAIYAVLGCERKKDECEN